MPRTPSSPRHWTSDDKATIPESLGVRAVEKRDPRDRSAGPGARIPGGAASGAELTTLKSRERGCGPTCAQVVTEAAKGAILREERRNAKAHLDEKKSPRKRRRTTRAMGTRRMQGNERSQLRSAPRESKPKGITNDQAKELAQL